MTLWNEWAGGVGAAIFAALSALHVFWAAGGKFGTGAVLPGSGRFGKGRIPTSATLAVAGALAVAALLMLGQGGLLLPDAPVWVRSIFKAGAVVLTLVFAARAVGDFRNIGFFKRQRQGRFAWWDTVLYSPLCVLISALALAVTLTG